MPEYLTPGVYMEEIEIGAKPIEGVGTSTAGFLGVTERGPVKPRLITSLPNFQRIYGDYLENSNLAYAVEGFFKNGGQRCFVARIIAKEDGDPASLERPDITNTKKFTVSAVGPGEWGNRVCVKIGNGTLADKKPELFKVTLVYFPEKYENIIKNDPLSNIDNSGKFTFDPTNPFNRNNKTRNDLSSIVVETYDNLSPDPNSADYYKKKINGISNLVIISDDIHLSDPPARPQNTDTKVFQWNLVATGSADAKALKDFLIWNFREGLLGWIAPIEPTAPPPDAETIEFKEDTKNSVLVKKSQNKATVTINGKPSYEFSVKEEGGTQIVYSSNILPLGNGSTKKDLSISDYRGFTKKRPDPNVPIDPNVPPDEKQMILERTGLLGFEEVDEINFICAPDEEKVAGLSGELIDHCEKLKDRFAILQSEMSDAYAFENLIPERESKYAALYFPWINVFDPLTNNQKLIPPGGYVAGIYARSDIERGVHKAPANEVVRGASSLQVQLTKEDQGILNPRGVNVIRSFPGRGIIVWGARTISTDPLWKYVNVRRLFLFLEESIEQATQWLVFEPNNERLWSRVIATITQFLTRVWRDGALMGTTPEQAFFVKCDRTTMTQDDIDNGRLIVLIGVAPVKPAEFVIFRIAQTKSGAEIEEL